MENKYFLSNNTKIRFLDRIISDLSECQAFEFSVSFIKKAGLVLLQEHIENALKRGASGKLLTSTYQNFTDVSSLEFFLTLQEKYKDRFECHLDFHCFGDDGFHTKGYLFDMGDHHKVIVGSSNITRFALLKNKEWDVSVTTNENEEFYKKIHDEFIDLWDHTYPLNREIIKRYTMHLQFAITSWDMDYFNPDNDRPITLNLMQSQALKELKRYRDMNVNRALVVAATGSGKTYLAAFDALNFDAHKLLFIVHKDVILEEAQKTFMKVFGTTRTYGIYTGESKQLDADFIFASNQIMSRHLELFSQDEFDYIVIDEVHHAAASTYQKIINYFKPQFLLGLTATPERMDGDNIYDLFGNNVPFDLRLRDALENDLIVPFHYYGIKDSLLNYSEIDSPEGMRQAIQQIASEPNCAFIKQEIDKHRPKGKLKCVGFCRTVEHARLMAQGMADQGFHTQYLTGSNTTGERIKVLSDLQDDGNPLEIVFAVDFMNEGVDIPAMNMVLFLRPTESSTIFIQQLGRGLRKYTDKPYLTVLDFIANSYKRSVQIALALGSLSKSGTVDKQALHDYIATEFKALDLSGLEIHLDKESKEEILKSLENTNFNRFEILKADFNNLCEFLKINPGYPKHVDFLNNEVNVDLLKYTVKLESYYDFLLKCGKDVPFFSENEINVIRSIYSLLPLVRPEEYQILKELFDGPKTAAELKEQYKNAGFSDFASFDHALMNLQDHYYFSRPKTHVKLVELTDNKYQLNFEIKSTAFREWLDDMIEYGLTRYQNEFYKKEENGLSLYHRYHTVQIGMALNHSNLNLVKGVINTSKGTCIMINLEKDWQKEERLQYKDKFLSNKVLQWESMTETTMTNKRGQNLFNQKNFFIFVRKTKTEDGADIPFVYLGKGSLTNPRVSDNPGKCLLFDIVLNNAVPDTYKIDFGIEDID